MQNYVVLSMIEIDIQRSDTQHVLQKLVDQTPVLLQVYKCPMPFHLQSDLHLYFLQKTSLFVIEMLLSFIYTVYRIFFFFFFFFFYLHLATFHHHLNKFK